MVEWDLYDGAWQYARTVDPSKENLAMEAIEEVGLGLATNHLQTRHTLEHFRSCFWLPRFVDRAGWKGAESDRAMLDKAQAAIEELLASYRKPEGRDGQLAEMRKVAERARGRIGTDS
jgi:trimethylamine:corrinoid methyltransferase-like protein